METSSVNLIIRVIKWLLNKLGYKVVPINNWIIEEVLVQREWGDDDPDILKEKQKGAKFCWAKVRNSNFEYYEVIKGNIKERYKSGNDYLWIHRPNLKKGK